MRRWMSIGALLGITLIGVTSPLAAATVVLGASRDNTLYEDAAGTTSNGAGEFLFSGLTVSGAVRRGLVAFDDVATQVPTGSTILAATLELNVSRTTAQGSEGFFLHRVLASWGEGSSNDTAGGGGGGTAATAGDATWLHRFYPSSFWVAAGGDYDPTDSEVSSANGVGPVVWSGPGMVADVQIWLDDPASNQGWLVRSNENLNRSAHRFDSRENAEPAVRPRLTIEFAPPGPTDVPAVSPLGLGCLALLIVAAAWAVRHRREA